MVALLAARLVSTAIRVLRVVAEGSSEWLEQSGEVWADLRNARLRGPQRGRPACAATEEILVWGTGQPHIVLQLGLDHLFARLRAAFA